MVSETPVITVKRITIPTRLMMMGTAWVMLARRNKAAKTWLLTSPSSFPNKYMYTRIRSDPHFE